MTVPPPIGEAPASPAPQRVELWLVRAALPAGLLLTPAGFAVALECACFRDRWSELASFAGLLLSAAGVWLVMRRAFGGRRTGHWVWFVLVVLLALASFVLRDAGLARARGPGGATVPGVIGARHRHWHLGNEHEPAWEFAYRWRAGGRTLEDAILDEDSTAWHRGDTLWVRTWPAWPEAHEVVDAAARADD